MKINNLNRTEQRILAKLDSPLKIQDYLDRLKINFEPDGDTCSSPRLVIRRGSAHCIEAALLGAAAMLYHGQNPLLLDLQATADDFDHVALLFRRQGRWGAVSKSNHLALRYRDPVYNSLRELALSFFHEYASPGGKKTLRRYSGAVSLRPFGRSWITAERDLWEIADRLDRVRHYELLPKGFRPRKADQFERLAGNFTEYSPKTGNLVKYKQWEKL